MFDIILFHSHIKSHNQVNMEESKNKLDIEIESQKKSYAGIPEADFVVSIITIIIIFHRLTFTSILI